MTQNFQVTQQDVNRVAKYIYNHTDGAYKIKFGANYVDVYMRVYYHTGVADEPVQEMKLDINMTSYSGKIRYNVTELTVMENTFLHGTIQMKSANQYQEVKTAIYERIKRAIQEEFAEYDFIF